MPGINVLAGGVVQAQNVNGGFYALGTNIFEFYGAITHVQNGFSEVGTYNLYGDINLTVYSTLKPFVFGIYDQYGDEPYYTEIVYKSVADSVEMSGGQSDTLRALGAGQTLEVNFGYKYWYPDIIKVNAWFDGDNDVYQTGLYDPIFTYVPFTFFGVNDAPILVDRSLTLFAELEDALAPVDGQSPGTGVSSLMAGISDYDSNGYSNTGIAITGLDTTNGTWWYTTGSGSSYDWIQITGVVSESHALLLTNLTNGSNTGSGLYFKPNADFNGTIANAITFRAWDKTSGTAGTYANITTSGTGGTTPFSTATDTASITVVAVNDAPRITAL